MNMDHDEKCAYISTFSKRGFTVLSEVGSKDASKIIAPYKWINLMQKELSAGAWKVIAEAREGGNVGEYRIMLIEIGKVKLVLHGKVMEFEMDYYESPEKVNKKL